MIHLAKRKKDAQVTGEPAPANERQARQFAADGTRLQSDENAYARRLVRAKRYVQTTLAKSSPAERRQLIVELRAILDRLVEETDSQERAPSQDGAPVEQRFPLCVPPTDANPGAPRPASLPLSSPSARPQTAGTATEVNRRSQPGLASAAGASSETAMQVSHQPGGDTDQEQPGPVGKAGSVLGLNMDEARRLGYCPK